MHPDPLAGFNEPVFGFNRWLDDRALRPVARGYSVIAPEGVRLAVGRFFDNVNVIPRFVNNVLQLRFERAGTEAARFGVNSTIGLVGFFDPALNWLDLEPAPNDFGLTLRTYGVPGGPYLMLPFLGPSTVTDTAGRVADTFMNPIPWFVSFPVTLIVSVSRNALEAVNYRSLHLDQFGEVDRYSVDLYGAVQDFYLQHRARRVEELRESAAAERATTQPDDPEERTRMGRWRRVR
jgi:phospholipid-binding lipoprotein MlaA